MAEELKSPLLTSSLTAPVWAQDMARKYASSALSLFILYGNVLDLVAYEGNGKKSFESLPDFLTNVFFARRGLVITYDLSNGIQCPKPEMRQAVMTMVKAMDTARGTDYYDKGLPKDPLKAVELISRWDPLESTCRHASLSIL